MFRKTLVVLGISLLCLGTMLYLLSKKQGIDERVKQANKQKRDQT